MDKNEWEHITPKEYVEHPRHNFVEEGTSDYHQRNIEWMIKDQVREALQRFAEEVKKVGNSKFNWGEGHDYTVDSTLAQTLQALEGKE